jgi:hypothetical protein
MPTNAAEIVEALRTDLAREARRGQRPVLVNLGTETRKHLEAAAGLDSAALTFDVDDVERLLGIPVAKDPAINPAGIIVEYEPKP